MFFLVRMAFWLTIVLAILPTGSSEPQALANGSQIDAMDAMVAAGAAVSDMSGFCERQPETCKVGAQAAVAIGQRAQAGANMVYDFINERMAKGETVPANEAMERFIEAMTEPEGPDLTIEKLVGVYRVLIPALEEPIGGQTIRELLIDFADSHGIHY